VLVRNFALLQGSGDETGRDLPVTPLEASGRAEMNFTTATTATPRELNQGE